jgi:NTP pyrophosphatase (non-canonical NTP hydrolase)
MTRSRDSFGVPYNDDPELDARTEADALTMRVLKHVIDERRLQDAKWGSQRQLPPEVWLAILTEKVGEVAEQILEARAGNADVRDLRNELIQVAAVATTWLEALV